MFPDRARLGGAPGNTAYHAACLGADSALVSRVGNDEPGARALNQLAQYGVDVAPAQLDSRAPTGSVAVTLHAGEPSYEIADAVAWDRITWQDSLAPELVERALGVANAVKLNEAEATQLARWFGQSDPVSWLIRERGIGLVAVTRGARGARLVTATEEHEHPGAPLSSAGGDPVGAGDAFSAALGLQLSRRQPMSVCLARANRYAAHVASHAGGMPPPPAWLGQVA